jgi:hypothetical protein
MHRLKPEFGFICKMSFKKFTIKSSKWSDLT